MGLSNQEIEDVAQRLASARHSGNRLHTRDLLTTPLGSVSDAYAIQEAVLATYQSRDDHAPKVWKAGAPDAASDALVAQIFPNHVYTSPASMVGNNHSMVGVEAELAFRFSYRLTQKDKPYTPNEVLDAIDGVFVTIEVIESRFKDWDNAGELWQLADGLVSGGLVQGTGIEDWRSIKFEEQQVRVAVDGQTTRVAKASHPLADPTLILSKAVNHVIERDGELTQHSVITTGSWVGIVAVGPGGEVKVTFPGIGEAKALF